MFVGTTEAAFLLGISAVRVRQLLQQGRVEGAVKIGRCWRIPLINDMPKIIEADWGPPPTWRKRQQEVPTIIHVFKQVIGSNQRKGENIPPIIVRRGSRVTHCHEVDIHGPSRMVYRPHQKTSHDAKVWLEVEQDIRVDTKNFT
jgi:hypothetical protein